MMDFKEGEVLYFNKPLGWTSFKVVGHARYHICRRMKVKKLKVGHAGTLDPLATGVMIVCTGKATKRIEEFQYHTKEYIATIRFRALPPLPMIGARDRRYLSYGAYHAGAGGGDIEEVHRRDTAGAACFFGLYGERQACLRPCPQR